MAELKTRPTDASVQEFLQGIEDERTREDCFAILKLMEEATGERPKMWGVSMAGFGSYHYKQRSGQEADWFVTGFSPRKRELTLYIMPGFEQFEGLMKKLGKHKTGKSCLFIKRLADIDIDILGELIELSVEKMRNGGCCGEG